ncbi:hypothetical protein DSL72_009004 [Monilinia vaccinii-corymbosi]|uniref:Uncharacterized protein n=1 Tax=Monilinia vaccinii-corymbosi TaxID=61207 RepID=A0A8A3PPU0_9HELO|nr:hypothetical protein DSL72_009004 [Monilinia vaccinii-corymbosi]
MAIGGEKEHKKRLDGEKLNDDKKLNGNKKIVGHQDKLEQLKRRFVELENKYLCLKEKSGVEDVVSTNEPEHKEVRQDSFR